jgi:hypothetical protein
VWARVHKVDRIKPQPGGSAIVLVEDERSAAQMQRLPALTTLVAIARILNAKKALDVKFSGKGQIRYAVGITPPLFLSDAVIRAGASVVDSTGEKVLLPASPGGLSSIIDTAFAELAHQARGNIGAADMAIALKKTQEQRRKTPLDREAAPDKYWTAVFELTALAGELSRNKGGRWVETDETPVPFALKFPKGELAHPAKLAQKIVEGDESSLAEEPVVAKP